MDMRMSVMKSAEEQRYTLGIAYPANELDVHGEYTTPQQLEQTAWEYMAKGGGIGLQHTAGTLGHGVPVESYIYRGPDWTIGDQTVHAGDWLLGVVWDAVAWDLIKKGILNGYSIDGVARRQVHDVMPTSDEGGGN